MLKAFAEISGAYSLVVNRAQSYKEFYKSNSRQCTLSKSIINKVLIGSHALESNKAVR
jgi:hypothetical protein